jgi:hypothetical protein
LATAAGALSPKRRKTLSLAAVSFAHYPGIAAPWRYREKVIVLYPIQFAL